MKVEFCCFTGCETRSVAFGEAHKLRMLRKIFGLVRDDEEVDCTVLHNEKLPELHWSSHVVRVMGRTCGTYQAKINACGVLEEKLKEKCHLKNLPVDGTIILKMILKTWGLSGV